MERREFEAGAVIPTDGQNGFDCYLIEQGLVAVSLRIGFAPAPCVALLGPGSLLGAGDDRTIHSAIVPVIARAVPARLLREATYRQPHLRALLDMQMRQRLAQTQAIAACNAQHSMGERCARLLLRLRAVIGDDIPVTHGSIADLLGVRRAGISVTLEGLRQKDIVRQLRGRIVVLDPERLAGCACACQNEFADSDSRIMVEMLRPAPNNVEPARGWIEQQISIQHPGMMEDDRTWQRRQAALRVCRVILERGRSVLGSMPPALDYKAS